MASSRSMFNSESIMVNGGTFSQYFEAPPDGLERLKAVVAHAAFHNSGERSNPPKCHPGTRVAVIQKIMDWIYGINPEAPNTLIMWLHGAVGVGKSAIAQAIAERCYAEHRLLGSFFFGRSSPTRNHAKFFFPTIAYQMVLVLPQIRDKVAAAVEHDTLIFTRSLSTQFTTLIVEPLQELVSEGFFDEPSSPRIVLIDGLDECVDRQVQCTLLDIIFAGVYEHHLPIIFLIASRPDYNIAAKFDDPEIDHILNRFLLDDANKPGEDIELFLRESFNSIKETHPFRRSIPPSWPTDEVINKLVRKSSGQFIYAATVVEYVKDLRRQPVRRLEGIFIQSASRDRNLPFAELDALYRNIFLSVEDVETVLDILSFLYLFNMSICDVEEILSMDAGDVQMFLCDLGSVLTFEDGHHVHFLHASFWEFLLSQPRSKDFYVDLALKRTEHVQRCFRYSDKPLTDMSCRTFMLATEFITMHCWEILPTSALREDILKFSIVHLYESSSDLDMSDFNYRFLPEFLTFIRKSPFDDAEQLYTHHLKSFDQGMRLQLQQYYQDIDLTFLVARVHFLITQHLPQLNDTDDTDDYLDLSPPYPLPLNARKTDPDDMLLCLKYPRFGFCKLVFDFLDNPARAGEYALDAARYAAATLSCLQHLCHHGSTDQKTVYRSSKRESEMRRKKPWSWRRNAIRRRGAAAKAQIWRRDPTGTVYYAFMAENNLSNWNDTRVARENNLRKYDSAFQHLLYFLPKAGRSENLITFVRRRTFAPQSQNFPDLVKQAKRAIAEYLERVHPEGSEMTSASPSHHNDNSYTPPRSSIYRCPDPELCKMGLCIFYSRHLRLAETHSAVARDLDYHETSRNTLEDITS